MSLLLLTNLWLCDEMFCSEPPFRLLPATDVLFDWTEGGVPLLSFLDLLFFWLAKDEFCVGLKAGGLSSPDSWVSLSRA